MTVWLAGAGAVAAGRVAAEFPVPAPARDMPIGLSAAALARDHADRLVGDGPGDAGGGLAAVAVAVQPGGGQVAAERHAGEPELGDDGVDHGLSPSGAGA